MYDTIGDIVALIHSSLLGVPELSGGGVTVSPGSPVFQLMSDGSDIFYPPNYGNKNKNENEDEVDNENQLKYNVDYADLNETEIDVVLHPLFINEAAYNEKDIAFMLMLRMEVEVEIVTI